MRKGLIAIFVIGLIIVPLAVFGCKAKAQKEGEAANTISTEATMSAEDVVVTQTPVTEPAQGISGQETIPPTAAVPPAAEAAGGIPAEKIERNKEIQTALRAAGFYGGNIDGRIGPKTKRAIIEFQKAKGLKADGKAGPKTWAELEKHLTSR